MKLRFVSMPHLMTKPGDACWFESTIDGPHGNLWLYVWLPGDARNTALRVHVGKTIPQQVTVYTWDGNREAPTLEESMPHRQHMKLIMGMLVTTHAPTRKAVAV